MINKDEATKMIESYFERFDNDVKNVYSVAEEAKAKGLDPTDEVEIPLAKSLAEKSVGLIASIYPEISNKGVVERILELEKMYGKLDTAVAFKIAEEIANGKFCKFENTLQAIEIGTRVGFSYITLGVVSSPIEGFTGLKINKRKDGKEYISAYFSGPIRSAGTTASCVVLTLIDHLREIFGYEKYDPTEEEIKRYITENHDYHERITNLQYMPTDEEIKFLAKNLPIQIMGEPTESKEVSNYKNLERVDTNYIRGGMCLIFSEGLAQKAAKGFRLLNKVKDKGFKSSGFNFLEEYIKLHEKSNKGISKEGGTPTYIKDLVAGRPVFGHPSRSGSFRFRYGRGRNSGFSAASIHPATMGITDGFISTGTQLKIEKPTKGIAATSCDSIDGPIVKLFSGSVRKIKTYQESKKLYPDVEEIIYLGDLLFPFSDLANRNFQLIKPGYVEEWWKLELREKNPKLEEEIDEFNVSFEEAVKISNENKIPLHPEYIYFWTQISKEELHSLLDWINHARFDKKIIFPFSKSEQEIFKKGKRALELLGVEHEMTIENVVLNEKNSLALLSNLGIDFNIIKEEGSFEGKIDTKKYDLDKDVLSIINSFSKFEIKDKAGDFIGARMGRPEKAKLRKLTGSPNVLFPVGKEGGRLRNVYDAINVGTVRGEFPFYYCENCQKNTIYRVCEVCGNKTKKKYYCKGCEKELDEPCQEHERCNSSLYQNLDIKHYFESAKNFVNMTDRDLPPLIKGVRGLSSSNKQMEHLGKGILRAKHGLQVNKDGTIRFDATELPIVSFRPKEISVSVEKLREIGYKKDINGEELERDDQILELMPHDILLPSCPNGTDERADDVFLRVARFIDDLLVNFYGLDPIYNAKTKEDLIGMLGVCMAPHNCAGVVCRIIGFSKVQGLYASPYMHAAIRRDCDGDEAAIMILSDVLLNFSKKFLPSHRGGTQDAPLVLNAKIDAGEVDDQILDFELLDNNEYPLELYKLSEERKHSSEITIPNVEIALKEKRTPFANIGFTHDTSNINKGVLCSSYKTLGTMSEKVQHQMDFIEKTRAVDTSDAVRLVIERHFLRDLKGNLRKFSTQTFRCVKCNEIFRRPPLKGVCSKCGGKLIFTVNEGGIKKYLEPTMELAEKYHLSTYLRQNIELTKRYIGSIFGKEPEKQENIQKWF